MRLLTFTQNISHNLNVLFVTYGLLNHTLLRARLAVFSLFLTKGMLIEIKTLMLHKVLNLTFLNIFYEKILFNVLANSI